MDLAKTGYCRGGGTWGAIAPPIFFEIGRILALSSPLSGNKIMFFFSMYLGKLNWVLFYDHIFVW